MIAFFCSFHDESSNQPTRFPALAERMAASLSLISGSPAPLLVEPQAIYVRQTSFGRAPSRARRNRTPPLKVAIDESGRRILFDGWLDNRRELAARLGCPSDDAALVYAAAVDRWADTADLEAVGSYCAIVFTPATRTVRLARSPWSAPPLHYFRDEDTLAVASVPRVLHVCGAPRELDVQKLADNLYGNLTDERGWYLGSHRVGLGTVVEITGAGRRVAKYYDHLAPRRTRLPNDRAYIEAARALLDEAIACSVDGARKPGVLMSGGLDSATVAARLLHTLPSEAKLHTYTFTPHPAWNGRVDGHYFGDDRPLVEEFARMHPRIVPTFCDSAGADPTTHLDRMILATGIAPIGLPNMYMFDALYAAAAKDGCDLLLDADFGNRTFSNDGTWALVEYLLHGKFRQLYRALRAVSPGNGSLLEIFVRRSLLPLLPDWLWRLWRRAWGNDLVPVNQKLAMVRDAAVERHGLEANALTAGVLYHRSYLRSRRHATIDAFARGDMEGGDVAQGFEQLWGVRTRDVTAYRPFVEFCLGLPTEMFMRDGEGRWLARQLAVGLLPEAQRTNRRQGFHNIDWHTRMTPRLAQLRAEAQRAKGEPRVAALIDFDQVLKALDEWPEQGSVDPKTYIRHAVAVPRAIMAARFVNFVEGRNDL